MFARLSALFVTGFISFSAFSQDYYGALEGQFSVSPTGAATYSIPIEVPPGINGMQPNLSLVYNSQAGNGMLGVGWSLAGLSQITRCPATLEQDGFIDPVDFDDNDRFCLDGQRLIAVNGAYGADGTEYRTEIETFQKVVSQGQFGSGPEKFVVWTRTGEIVEFGFNSDSRLVNKEMNDALKWALSRITDNANNQLTIEYFTDYEKLFPLNAKYNFVNNAHSNLVEFGYESRSDYEDNGNGFLQIERYRLKNIRTFTGNNLVSNYNIFYNLVPDNTNTPYASKIEKIKHCSDILENQCHIPLDLSWSSEEVSLSNYMSGPPLSDTASWSLPQYYSTINYPDINGDGIPDICARGSAGIHCWKGNGSEFNYLDTGPYWSDAADWNKEIYYSTIQYPDIDGDGMADICGRGAAGIYCHLANGNGFDSAEINGPAWSNAASWSLPQYYSTIQYPDINGDGKADICGRGGAGIFCHLADGNGFESTLTLGPGWSDAADWNKEIYYSTIQYPDINGDGMADICGRGAAGIFCHLADGNGFESTLTPGPGWSNIASWSLPQYYSTIRYPDINGDGKADICGRGSAGIMCHLSNGEGFESRISWGPSWSDAADWNKDIYYSTIQYPDINGDGMADVCGRGSSGVFCHLSNGSGFESELVGGPGWSNAASWSLAKYYSTIRFVDVNGDSKADVCGRGSAGIHCNFSNLYGISTISSIISGDKQIDVSLRPITNNSIFTRNQQSNGQFKNIGFPLYVVENYSIRAANQLIDSIDYQYADAIINTSGRGFLGFNLVTSTNQIANVFTETKYLKQINKNSFWYNGLVGKVSTYLNGKLQSQTITSWGARLSDKEIVFPYVSTSLTYNNFIDGNRRSITFQHTNLIDEYGNVIDTTSEIKDAAGIVKQTIATSIVPSLPEEYGIWLPNLVKRTSTTVTENSVSETRTKAFEYKQGTGQLIAEITEPDLEGSDPDNLYLRKVYDYDSFGNQTSVTITGSSNATHPIAARTSNVSYDYSVPGEITIVRTNALNESDTQVIDARWGVPKSLTGPNQRTTTWDYDSFGRKIKETRANNTTTTSNLLVCTTSDACQTGEAYFSEVISTATPMLTTYYDSLGRKVRTATTGLNNLAIEKQWMYDSRGRLWKESNNYSPGLTIHWNVYSYDYLDRVSSVTAADGSVTTTTYDVLKTTITRTRTGQNGAATLTKTEEKNILGQTIKVIDADNNPITYSYTPSGKVETVTDSLGNQIVTQYDLHGRKVSLNDPDMGSWSYEYDALGNMRKQTDAKTNVFTFNYDVLGRKTSRLDLNASKTDHWIYYTAADPTSGRNIGKLKETRLGTGSNFRQTFLYDGYGNATSTTTILDGISYTFLTNYNSLGQLDTIIYPASGNQGTVAVRHFYDSNGVFKAIKSTDLSHTYWEAGGTNANNQITSETYNDGAIVSLRGYQEQTGLLTSITTGNGLFGTNIQNLHYGYDNFGNLEYREDRNQTLAGVTGVTEGFYYDTLNRLDYTQINGLNAQDYSYDAIGNITFKTGVGVYEYNGTGPHAVSNAGGQALLYDANGNMYNGRGKTIVYNNYNKPIEMTTTANGNTVGFDYDSNRKRFKQVKTDSDGTTTTYYVGKSFEKVERPGGVVEYNNFIYAGNRLIKIDTRRSNGANEEKYVHGDHLGSIYALTNADGSIKKRFNYDAFGKRRGVSFNDGLFADAVWMYQDGSNRGFTGHEHLDSVGLIHMNGRVYDPELGRFVSADPIIQSPTNMQSLNRYSYVQNNPLSATDPSGYKTVFDRFGDWARNNPNTFKYMVALSTVVAGGPLAQSILYGIYMASEAHRAGEDDSQAFLAGVFSGMEMYSLSTFAGKGAASFSKGIGAGMEFIARDGGKRVMNNFMRDKPAKWLAGKMGMTTTQMNLTFFVISATGNWIFSDSVGSRLKMVESDGYGLAFIDGVNTRGKGGWIFDAADVALSIQGLPTATFIDYVRNGKGMHIEAHSLGTMDAANLVANGYAPSASLAALPIGNIAPSGTKILFNPYDAVSFGTDVLNMGRLNGDIHYVIDPAGQNFLSFAAHSRNLYL